MNHMTQDNLRSAFGGESMAHTRYKFWGEKAKKEGFPNVSRLFMCTADAEEVHAGLHFNALRDEKGDFPVTSMAGFGNTNTSENLQGAIDGETFEFTQMYPAYIAVAEMQGEKAAVRAMQYAIEAEKVHAELFTKAKNEVDNDRDLEVETMLLCPICGYISLTGEEDRCPLCNAKKQLFIAY